MATITIKQRLTIVTIGYWVLLAYIIAALVWWFISLEQQNRLMTDLRLSQLQTTTPLKNQKEADILDLKRRKTAQYIGEGCIFMLLILVGAVYIFRATRRQLRLGQQQQNFMMAVTHELKTPIAITALNLQTLQKRRLTEVQQERLIDKSLEETVRLNNLCDNILLTAQLEGESSQENKEWIDLTALAKTVFERFQERFADHRFEGGKTAAIKGSRFMLELLISNLLQNAIKYSKLKGLIEMTVLQEGNKVVLRVKDEGPGIPDAEKKKVFQKFYRIGDERTRTSKGTGLGLYLCRRIMKNHGGDIRLMDNTPHGSIFTATFRL